METTKNIDGKVVRETEKNIIIKTSPKSYIVKAKGETEEQKELVKRVFNGYLNKNLDKKDFKEYKKYLDRSDFDYGTSYYSVFDVFNNQIITPVLIEFLKHPNDKLKHKFIAGATACAIAYAENMETVENIFDLGVKKYLQKKDIPIIIHIIINNKSSRAKQQDKHKKINYILNQFKRPTQIDYLLLKNIQQSINYVHFKELLKNKNFATSPLSLSAIPEKADKEYIDIIKNKNCLSDDILKYNLDNEKNFNYLLEAGAKVDFKDLVDCRSYEMLENAKKYCPDFYEQIRKPKKEYFTHNGSHKVFEQFLINNGFNINAKNSNGDTFLTNACKDINMFYDHAVYLLKKGANPFIKNKQGLTCLDYLLENKEKLKDMKEYRLYNDFYETDLREFYIKYFNYDKTELHDLDFKDKLNYMIKNTDVGRDDKKDLRLHIKDLLKNGHKSSFEYYFNELRKIDSFIDYFEKYQNTYASKIEEKINKSKIVKKATVKTDNEIIM